MKSRRKYSYIFKHYLLTATVNKVRLFLTSIGYFTAVFLFAFGTIYTDSYYNSQFSIIEDYYNSSVILKKGDYYNALCDEVYGYRSGKIVTDYVKSTDNTLLSVKQDDGSYLSVLARFHFLSEPSDVLAEITDEFDYLPVRRSIVEGRLLDSDDFDGELNSVVIDKSTADLLFDGESAVGKTFTLSSMIGQAVISYNSEAGDQKTEYTVVGVVNDSANAKSRVLKAQREISSKNENVILHTTVWAAFSGQGEFDYYSACSFDDESDFLDFSGKLQVVKYSAEAKGENQFISTRDDLFQKKTDELSDTRNLLALVEAVLMIVTGISIMGITFFSVKERVSEIGIRKAFGAGKLDIIFQFMFETVIIAFVTSVLSVFIAFMACRILEGRISAGMQSLFYVHVKFSTLLLPVFMGVLEAILCSIIPSVYGAKIKVTDALRFE